MNIKQIKKVIIGSLMLMCFKGNCTAQDNSYFEIYAHSVIVSDTDFLALLDTMCYLIGECGINEDSLFFYICESNFDGENHYFVKALPYTPYSYRELWNNDGLIEADELFWKTFYCFHKGILCIFNADNNYFFKEISQSSDKLLLPSIIPKMDSFYMVAVPRISDNCSKYFIYTSCN